MSKNKLTIIIGAGASNDSVPPFPNMTRGHYKPPLTKDLFLQSDTFVEILRQYPKAVSLSPRIIQEVYENNNSIEAILRRIKDQKPVQIKKQYWQVPFYFQHLFTEISFQYPLSGTNYHTLINEIIMANNIEVMFLTVNYDILLDLALETIYDHDFDTLDKYISKEKHWCLIKLHGSASWANKIENEKQKSFDSVLDFLDSFEDDEELKINNEIKLIPNYRINKENNKHRTLSIIGRDEKEQFYFPALSVPTGGGKDLICPVKHVEAARNFVKDCRNFLAIGFSAIDKDVLDILEKTEKVDNFMIVTKADDKETEHSAFDVYNRFNNKFKIYENVDKAIYRKGFSSFLSSRKLDTFLKEISGKTTVASSTS